jgi:phage-related protein
MSEKVVVIGIQRLMLCTSGAIPNFPARRLMSNSCEWKYKTGGRNINQNKTTEKI